MTDRMFLVDAPDWLALAVGDEVEVTGAEGRHAVAVVRLRPGRPSCSAAAAGARRRR